MLRKLIILYTLIIINLAVKTKATATFIKTNNTNVLQRRFANLNWSSLTNEEDTWQPMVKNQFRMNEKPSNTWSANNSSELSVNFRNLSTNNVKQKQRGYLKPQTYYNYKAYNFQENGNSTKGQVQPLMSAQILPTSSTTNSIKNIKLKSYVVSNNYKNNKTRFRGRGKLQLKSSTPHYNHQHQLYPLNNMKALYPTIQIPNDIISQVQEVQTLSPATKHHDKYEKNFTATQQLNLQHHSITDVKPTSFTSTSSTTTLPTSPSSSLLHWHYLPHPSIELKNIISLTPKNDTSNTNTTTKLINLNVNLKTIRNGNESKRNMENIKNFNANVSLTKTLNSFPVNKNFIDNEITNKKQHYTQTQYYNKTTPNIEIKTKWKTNFVKNEPDSFKFSNSTLNKDPATVTLNSYNNDNDVTTQDNLNIEMFLLKETLNKAKIFYNNIKDIILNDTDNSGVSSEDNNDDDDDDDNDDYNEDDDEDIYSNEEDKIHNDNDLQAQNILAPQAFKDDTSSTTNSMTAAIASAMENIDSLNIKNILLSTTATTVASTAAAESIGEVQGRQKQNDKGTIRYSLIKTQSSPQSTASFAADTNNTQYMMTTTNNDTILQEARARVWKLPIKKHKYTHTSLTLPTPKGLRIINSGRKVKKVKKKFKKFLLPLLLAYKLKFMALIPLLIGGLILLVGSTGMAGFFFALFTAVMSLKGGGRNSVIVKKYIH